MWKCKKCGEEIEDSFDACWKCTGSKKVKTTKKDNFSEGGEKYTINDKELICPFCQNKNFFTRESLLNTTFMTFFRLDWANKTADNYICDKCGYVMWFMRGF